ncbi:hypothetical protein TWF696_007615 [Orbilia brochopaga]|uniref:HNH nuclease domain-containing protein n=1 Tax=Orbilia brochopaga TaxID=3140254 RepID=A0AAV9UM92_9PEZI
MAATRRRHIQSLHHLSTAGNITRAVQLCTHRQRRKDNLAIEILLTVLSEELESLEGIKEYSELLALAGSFQDEATGLEISDVIKRLESLGDYFYDNLIRPYMRTSRQTQPSYLNVDTQTAQGQSFPTLEDAVLNRDRRRCIITKLREWSDLDSLSREEEHNEIGFASCEAAHIFPHALNDPVNEDTGLSDAKALFWALANMFDSRLADALRGDNINLPNNGLTLTHDCRIKFGSLKFWLTAIPGAEHSYKIGFSTRRYVFRPGEILSDIVFFQSEDKRSLPDPRYLAFHRALALAVRASGTRGESLQRHDVQCLSEDGADARFLNLALREA